MLRSKVLVLLSALAVAGCPATSMLHSQKYELRPPPYRTDYSTQDAYLEAIATYQQYIDSYRSGLIATEESSQCTSVLIANEFSLPPAPTIVSDDPAEQVSEVLDYVDSIRAAVKNHNEMLNKQIELFTKLCPSVDKYVVP